MFTLASAQHLHDLFGDNVIYDGDTDTLNVYHGDEPMPFYIVHVATGKVYHAARV